ncbi:hypothetical protein CABS01_14166 [Colletotrichum abscissum]|uniref:Uncharacterized protein n=1 Tax=Colletotrichum abscissum TaxID=1671311 RepID=A0A9P9X7L2_9PEZI|nr:uncharacterized protein CABS01_14166 [Colletotrichum abscissum]KAI3540106.1 hypothetical protein CABS02_11152 [Colletotrichum abscissum]KAK1481968.1 hypothetical protein CABS01_14166 [Colletotrichum abscissum]
MAAIGAVATLGTAIGNVATFLGLVSSGIGIMSAINTKPKEVDFYTIRMEIGDNQDAAGNPPSIILSDFSNTQIFGVFEGNSDKPEDQCRNNGDLELFKGLKNAEAPIQSFKTNNGFNLKSLDIQPGGNAICVSNIILKGSDTQARRDEVFIPVGDLGFQCGREWNWGAVLNGVRQRCIWLDGQPDGTNKPIQSLHLDMENLAGIFNKGKNDTLAKTTFEQACKYVTDNVGQVANRNSCKESFSKRSLSGKNQTIDTVPFLEEISGFFNGKDESLTKFAGAPFITSDNKIWDSTKKAFTDVSPKNVPAKRSRHFARMEEKRGLASTLKGERCEYAANGAAPVCKVVKEFAVGSA